MNKNNSQKDIFCGVELSGIFWKNFEVFELCNLEFSNPIQYKILQ